MCVCLRSAVFLGQLYISLVSYNYKISTLREPTIIDMYMRHYTDFVPKKKYPRLGSSSPTAMCCCPDVELWTNHFALMDLSFLIFKMKSRGNDFLGRQSGIWCVTAIMGLTTQDIQPV